MNLADRAMLFTKYDILIQGQQLPSPRRALHSTSRARTSPTNASQLRPLPRGLQQLRYYLHSYDNIISSPITNRFVGKSRGIIIIILIISFVLAGPRRHKERSQEVAG